MSPDILFYFFAALTAGSALAVVLNKNTIASALCLLVSLVGVAAIFVLLDAFLLAALMVFVYAGAVVALFLFIVMLLDTYGGDRKPFKKATIVSSGFALALLVLGLVTFADRSRNPRRRSLRDRRGSGRRQPPRLRRTTLHDLPASRADRRIPTLDRHAWRDRAQQKI